MTYSIYLERESNGTDGVREQQTVLRVLSDHGLAPSNDGYAWVETGDGGSAEMHVADADLVALNYVSLSPGLVRLIFAIAQSGYRVFAENSERALTTSPERVSAGSKDDWAVVLCASPDEMLDALGEGFEEWSDYRDQVVDDADPGLIRRLFSRLERR